METGGRPRKKNKPEDSVLLEQYRTMTAQEVADIYGVSRDTVRSWVYAARKRRALAAGSDMSADQVLELQHLRGHLEQLRSELDRLNIPSEMEFDIERLPKDGTAETSYRRRYIQYMHRLPADIRQLRNGILSTSEDITHILNSISSLNNIQIWDHIPEDDGISIG